jgi:unsaturated chondroitin disaccharide hydrolase
VIDSSWASAALGRLVERVDVMARQVGQRFPLYADTSTGDWRTTRRGSWTGGFWTGLLALHVAATGSATCQRRGDVAWRDLQQWRNKDTACRGLIFWYGSLGARLTAPGPPDDLLSAARVLTGAFDPDLGLVPWGSAFGGVREAARVDGVAGLVPLLGWAARQDGGSPTMRSVAARHLRRHLDLCVSNDGVQPAFAVADGGARWQPLAPPGAGWSRGVAWLLLSCVDGSRWLDPGFEESAVALAGLWRDRFGRTELPLADADQPCGPVDSSSAAIASVALLKLSALTGEDTWWESGSWLLRCVVDQCQVADGPARGGVAHGCYDLDSGVAADHELVWGDFFCAAGLAMLTGLVPVTAV